MITVSLLADGTEVYNVCTILSMPRVTATLQSLAAGTPVQLQILQFMTTFLPNMKDVYVENCVG